MFSEVCLTEANADRRHNLPSSSELDELMRYLARETTPFKISGYRLTDREFPLGIRKLFFSLGMHRSCFLSVAVWETATYFKFINLINLFIFN